MSYEYPTETPYGKIIMNGTAPSELPGVFDITGTGGSGYMVHQDAAHDILSPAAIHQGNQFGDYLCYNKKSTGCILEYELYGRGLFRQTVDKKGLAQAVRAIHQNIPSYAEAMKLPPPAQGRRSGKAAPSPVR